MHFAKLSAARVLLWFYAERLRLSSGPGRSRPGCGVSPGAGDSALVPQARSNLASDGSEEPLRRLRLPIQLSATTRGQAAGLSSAPSLQLPASYMRGRGLPRRGGALGFQVLQKSNSRLPHAKSSAILCSSGSRGLIPTSSVPLSCPSGWNIPAQAELRG